MSESVVPSPLRRGSPIGIFRRGLRTATTPFSGGRESCGLWPPDQATRPNTGLPIDIRGDTARSVSETSVTWAVFRMSAYPLRFRRPNVGRKRRGGHVLWVHTPGSSGFVNRGPRYPRNRSLTRCAASRRCFFVQALIQARSWVGMQREVVEGDLSCIVTLWLQFPQRALGR